jgi:tetracycline repressor-like protein
VDQLWAEIPEPSGEDWREAVRGLAQALRELVHQHPHAAPLLTSRRTVQERSLRIWNAVLRVMRAGGVPDETAVPLLHVVFAYGIGFALAELSFPVPSENDIDDEIVRIHRVTAVLPPHVPDELIRTALLVCGGAFGSGCDMRTKFDVGLDLMIRGLDSYLGTAAETVASAQ